MPSEAGEVNRRLDTSVIPASLDPEESHHCARDTLVAAAGPVIYVPALAETFSILTGGRKGRRLRAAVAARLVEQSVLPFVRVQTLNRREVMTALAECASRGVRGGAVRSTTGCIWRPRARPASMPRSRSTCGTSRG